jgi:serine/threonine protein kinase
MQDAEPVPKVIDLGVAKALHQRLTERTMYTAVGAVIGTLEYMSPEQAELSALDVDTRTDVYALGVLLYELLTGSTPLGQRLRSAPLAERLRLIREEEPLRPSSRLSQSSETLHELADRRRTEPARLSREVRGDLDWITLALREGSEPDAWTTLHTRSLLGAALVAHGNQAEGEPLLRQGYDGLVQRISTIPVEGKARLRETATRLAQLLSASGRNQDAAKWRSDWAGARASAEVAGR